MVYSSIERDADSFMAEEAVLIVPGDLEAERCSNQLHYIVNTINHLCKRTNICDSVFPLLFLTVLVS